MSGKSRDLRRVLQIPVMMAGRKRSFAWLYFSSLSSVFGQSDVCVP